MKILMTTGYGEVTRRDTIAPGQIVDQPKLAEDLNGIFEPFGPFDAKVVDYDTFKGINITTDDFFTGIPPSEIIKTAEYLIDHSGL